MQQEELIGTWASYIAGGYLADRRVVWDPGTYSACVKISVKLALMIQDEIKIQTNAKPIDTKELVDKLPPMGTEHLKGEVEIQL